MTVRVTSVESTASAQGILKIGDSVTFTVALDRPVEVSGVPLLITSEGDLAGDMYGGTTSHLVISQSIEAACE